jgi:hypothetical protein
MSGAEDFICVQCGGVCDPTGNWEDSTVLVCCRECETKQWKPFTFNSQYVTSDWGKEAREKAIAKQLNREEYDPTYYLKKEAW